MDEILNEQHIPQEAEILEADFQQPRRNCFSRNTLRFCALLFAGILGLLVLLLCLTIPLRTLLNQYEVAQPEQVATEIFDTLFADPDWALLYDMSGVEPTEFEGRNEFVAYMTAKTGGKKLHYVEIPAAPTGEKQYSVRLEEEQVATFTMRSVDDGVSTFKRWTIGKVNVFFTRQESVTVTIVPSYTVYINGVALDDSYTTLLVTTPAEDYLPEGLHGYRYQQLTVTDLLVQPNVVVLDQYNNRVTLTKDPETGDYATPIPGTVPMTWGEEELILETANTHALFAIRAIPATQLREFFTPGSMVYEAISTADPLAEDWKSYALDDSGTVIKDFYRYSDTLFSVWAQVKLDVTATDGSVTSYTIGGSYFFTTGSTGNPVATELYDVDLQELLYDHREAK